MVKIIHAGAWTWILKKLLAIVNDVPNESYYVSPDLSVSDTILTKTIKAKV